MRKFFPAILVLFLLGGCIGNGEAELSNWPYGYSSAVTVTFETERASDDQLQALVRVLNNNGAKATFFIIAGYYQENPDALEVIRDFEVANMGWYQTTWKDSSLTKEFQDGEIRRGHDWLTAQGFEVRGFRSPFLKSTKETYAVLHEMGYTYDSSEFYGFMPYKIGSIVEIPLSVNYDLYWDEPSMKYSTMPAYIAFQKSQEESGLFTFYGHASRTYDHLDNFDELMSYASKRNVWFASASEVADWWNKRVQLELWEEGDTIMVGNKGGEIVSGATVKIKGEWDASGVTAVKNAEGYTYALLPDLDPGAAVAIGFKKR